MRFLIEKFNSLNELENYLGSQETPIMWSTYILPNGRFLNLELDSDPDSGEHILAKKNIDEQLLEDTCIKINVNDPQLYLPNNQPTMEQYKSLRKWLDIFIPNQDRLSMKSFYRSFDITEFEHAEYIQDIPRTALFVFTSSVDAILDTQYETSTDIIKHIKKYYSTRRFY